MYLSSLQSLLVNKYMNMDIMHCVKDVISLIKLAHQNKLKFPLCIFLLIIILFLNISYYCVIFLRILYLKGQIQINCFKLLIVLQIKPENNLNRFMLYYLIMFNTSFLFVCQGCQIIINSCA